MQLRISVYWLPSRGLGLSVLVVSSMPDSIASWALMVRLRLLFIALWSDTQQNRF